MTPQQNRPKPQARPKQNGQKQRGQQQQQTAPARTVSRGAAIRAQKRNSEMANKLANEYLDASATKLEKELMWLMIHRNLK